MCVLGSTIRCQRGLLPLGSTGNFLGSAGNCQSCLLFCYPLAALGVVNIACCLLSLPKDSSVWLTWCSVHRRARQLGSLLSSRCEAVEPLSLGGGQLRSAPLSLTLLGEGGNVRESLRSASLLLWGEGVAIGGRPKDIEW